MGTRPDRILSQAKLDETWRHMEDTMKHCLLATIVCLFGCFPVGYIPAGFSWGPSEVSAQSPVLVDMLSFEGKPDLGMSTSVTMIYEWEMTLRDEARQLKALGSRNRPSALTIEAGSLFATVGKRKTTPFIVLDIESLKVDNDSLAIEYMRLARLAAPGCRIAWWNPGPGPATNIYKSAELKRKWQSNFERRQELVEASDFCIIAAYFSKRDTLLQWKQRNLPRIAEARRLFGDKPVMVTLAPHPFDAGRPWQHVGEELMGGAIDACADSGVDFIPVWSVEGTRQIQPWDERWGWVKAIRDRAGEGGVYRKPNSQGD